MGPMTDAVTSYRELYDITEDPVAAAILVHALHVERAIVQGLPMALLRGGSEIRGNTMFVAEGLESSIADVVKGLEQLALSLDDIGGDS